MKRDKFPVKKLLLPILLVGLIFSETVNAGWAFAARKVIGRINQMTQDDSNGNPAFQFATVIIDAPAIKVYSTAVNVVSQNQAITIVSQDAKNLKLKVSEGNKSISLSVVSLSDKSSEIMISATAAPQSQDPSTSPEVDAILKICKQLNKVCKTGAN
ncbi:hypothetical protein [Polynucleobacter sp.]|jgi:hypothetical protein|uniref:hypothetical protein n=1 Tax=Polynucleobacter sp. TaxID=2029855 RepID=UPI00333FFFAF